MMVRLFSRDAVAKSPCTCGSLPGIYTLISCANSCAFFEIFTHDTILFQLTLYHGQNHETIEKQRKNPETLIYQGFGIWWT